MEAYTLIASCVPGLEGIVAEDLIGRPFVVRVLGIRRGRIVFEASEIHKVLGLRSIENLYLYLGEFHVPQERTGLDVIRDGIRGLDIAIYFDLMDRLYGIDRGGARFRCTAHRTGVHAYTSMDIASAAGESIKNTYGLKVNLKDYEYDVHLWVTNNTCVVCGRITKYGLHRRSYRTYVHPTMLNPTIAYIMCFLARKYNPSCNCILDPFCGSATIPIEFAMSYPDAIIYCGDIDPVYVRGSRGEIKALGLTDRIHISILDARCLPFRDCSFDAIVSNMPYGWKCGSHRINVGLYPAVMSEMCRLGTNNCIFVLLTMEKNLLKSLIEAHEMLLIDEYLIYQGGLYPSIYVLKRV